MFIFLTIPLVIKISAVTAVTSATTAFVTKKVLEGIDKKFGKMN